MKKFSVYLLIDNLFTVEAETEKEALEKVYQHIEKKEKEENYFMDLNELGAGCYKVKEIN